MIVKTSAPRNNLARLDGQRRDARAAVPSSLPAQRIAGHLADAPDQRPVMATHSEFARFEERVEDTMETRFHRFEAKIDNIGAAITRLMVFEERQAQQSKLSEEIARQVAANRDQADQRTAAMAERFDKRLQAVEALHAGLRLELHGYVQRMLGVAAVVSVVAGSGFAFFLRLVN